MTAFGLAVTSSAFGSAITSDGVPLLSPSNPNLTGMFDMSVSGSTVTDISPNGRNGHGYDSDGQRHAKNIRALIQHHGGREMKEGSANCVAAVQYDIEADSYLGDKG